MRAHASIQSRTGAVGGGGDSTQRRRDAEIAERFFRAGKFHRCANHSRLAPIPLRPLRLCVSALKNSTPPTRWLLLRTAAVLAAIIFTPLHAADENVSRALAGADLLVGTLKDAASNKLDFTGNKTFTVDQLRAPIAEQIRELQEKGITPVRADDTAYYVGAFFR